MIPSGRPGRSPAGRPGLSRTLFVLCSQDVLLRLWRDRRSPPRWASRRGRPRPEPFPIWLLQSDRI